MAKRTTLYDWHVEHGARCIDFHEWEMPVQYTSIIEEHSAVRSDVGLFDVSHMGELIVEGPDALAFLQKMVTNDLSRIHVGRATYTLMTAYDGGTMDDFLVYQIEDHKFMVVVNAGNIERDFAWFCRHASDFRVDVKNVSDDVALIALQGPRAAQLLTTLIGGVVVQEMKPFRFTVGTIGTSQVLISRTGYTGEDGFELYMSSAFSIELANMLVAEGAVPCGLGARDTLRIEAYLPLYGQELTRDISPLEAALEPFVKFKKDEFIGRDVLVRQRNAGIQRRRVGIQMLSRAIPRTGYVVYCEGKRIGFITSGTHSPTLKKPIGIALLDVDYTRVGLDIEIEVRGKFHPAQIVETPFYQMRSR